MKNNLLRDTSTSMKARKGIVRVLAGLLLACALPPAALAQAKSPAPEVSIVPRPLHWQAGRGSFALTKGTAIVLRSPELTGRADQL